MATEALRSFGVKEKTPGEIEQVALPENQQTPQELMLFRDGVASFRPFILRMMADSQLSKNENRALSYEENDGHWKSAGNIPGPNGEILASFTVGLKVKPDEDGKHEPYASIAYPHIRLENGNELMLYGADAILEIYNEIEQYYNPGK